MNAPMVKIARLYEKTSQKGNRSFIGRQNGTRLLRFATPDKQHATDSDWLLYVRERDVETLPANLELTGEELPPAEAA